MSERTVLLCPKCNSNLSARIETKRYLDFSDCEYGPRGLFAVGPRQYWGIPGGDDGGEECESTNCTDADCDSKHNYDAQKNKELLENPEVDKVFTYDWDYQEEYNEEITRVTTFYCPVYSCDFEQSVTEVARRHLETDNVG